MKKKIGLVTSSITACLILLMLILAGSSADAKPRDKERWNKYYDTDKYIFGEKPIRFLKENIHLLRKGKTLDIAMGEGRNGVYLATKGFDVLGLDISEKGLEKAHQLASANKVKIATQVADLETHQLTKNAYDLIICTYYMQRSLFPQFMDALKPGGMALVETYNLDYLKYKKFKRKYLLEDNELLKIFADYKIIKYEIYDDGVEAYSSIIVQKPQ
jgi:2-polyprenyl-3-methyl-5-hydroxy-6-metoxy-1,4-benzoquinol methylase